MQRFWPALQPPGTARPAWLVLGALLAEVTGGTAPRSAADAFAQLGGRVPAFAGLTYEDTRDAWGGGERDHSALGRLTGWKPFTRSPACPGSSP